MKGAIAWFARNGVAANLLMALVILAGAMALIKQVRREVFPSVSLEMVRVLVPYPGATPEEVEDGVILRIEEAVADLEGLKEMNATAAEGAGTVMLEAEDGYDVRELLDDVKSRIDAIIGFPDDAEEPIIDAPSLRARVMALAVAGDLERPELRHLAERLRNDLLAHEPEARSFLDEVLHTVGLVREANLSQVELGAVRDYQISIEVSERSLQRYDLTFEEMAAAVRRGSLDLPAGAIRRYEGEVLLRTQAQAWRGDEFAALPLRTMPDGRTIRLGDVARVEDGFAPDQVEAWLDGRPAAFIDIYVVGDQDILAVSAAARDFAAAAAEGLPPGVELQIWDDTSEYFKSRLDTLARNGLAGLLLVFVILSLFLHLRLAIWVSLGIPISFLGAIWVMPQVDASINMISMFAFILVLGIVVDDAIVVAESIHTCQEEDEPEGGGLLAGSIRGAGRVATPVFFAVVTSVVAFMPMLFISGVSGKFFRLIPIVVIGCLLFSLIESFFVLPAHLSHRFPLIGSLFRHPLRMSEWLQTRVERLLFFCIDHAYRPGLRCALRWRYLTLSLFLSALVLTAGLFVGGFVRTEGFPTMEGDRVTARVTMPLGTSYERTREAVQRLVAAAGDLQKTYKNSAEDRLIAHVFSAVGTRLEAQPFGDLERARTNVGEALLVLEDVEEHGIRPSALERAWRQRVGPMPEAETLEFNSSLGRDSNRITIQIRGYGLGPMQAAVEELKTGMQSYRSVYGVTDSFSGGKEELIVRLTPAGELAGLRAADLARQLRIAIYGEEAQRIQRGRDEVKVMIRYPEALRESLLLLDTMRVRTPGGEAVPLASVATMTWTTGTPVITRTDRLRTIDVSCNVDTGSGGNVDEVLGDLQEEVLPDILARHRGLTWSLKEAAKDQADAMQELMAGFVIALLIMYGLMAIAFGSWLQPAVVMVAIPFGIVGAIWAHLLLGLTVSMLSMFGLVALSGVVVNDSLVLIDQVNRLRDEGRSVREALAAAGPMRFRAILLTTLTTFCGLIPLMLETSVQARFLIPMAVSLAFGVLFATTITLILIPCIYEILEDIHDIAKGVYRKLGNGSA